METQKQISNINIFKIKILITSKSILKKKLGYYSDIKFNKIINEFLISDNLFIWFNKKVYDMKYNSKTFLYKLIIIFNLQKEFKLKIDIEYNLNKIETFKRIKTPFVHIELEKENINYKGSFFTAMFIQKLKHINIKKEEVFNLEREEELLIVKNKINKFIFENKENIYNLTKNNQIKTFIYNDLYGNKINFSNSLVE